MLPDREIEAIEAPHGQSLLDTLPNEVLNRLAGLAIHLFETRFALISLADGSRTWSKAHNGAIAQQVQQIARLCANLVSGDSSAVVPDASVDPRLREHPLLAGEPTLRFVAVVPLVATDGRQLGIFSIADPKPRQLGVREVELLQGLAACARAEIEQRFALLQTRDILDGSSRALEALTRSSLLEHPDAGLNMPEILATVAHTLRVQRTSLWRLRQDGGGIVCQQLFDTSEGKYTSGMALARELAPAYFSALANNEAIVANDALLDPRTRELAPGYLEPLGISSMLDAPVFVSGRLSGVLCCEHVGPPRHWTHAERSFAVAVANLFALNVARRSQGRSEARLRTILASEPDCVMVVAPDRRVLDINPAGVRLLGARDEAQVRGHAIAQFVHPRDRQAYLELHDRAIGGASGELAFRIIRLDGTQRWLEANSAPLRQPGGKVEAVLTVTRDVSERLESQHALAERIKELRCLYQILEFTTDDTRPVSEICGDVVAVLPASLRHAQSAAARIILGEDEFRSPGWSPPSQSLARPIRSMGEDVGRVEVGYPDDLPEHDAGWNHFLAEEAELLEVVATHLGRMLHDRRIAEMLLQSERQRAIGQLTGGIAHDFNNLLQVMLGTAEELAEALADDEALRPLAEMGRTAARRGAELTSRLLAFSRQQALEPEAIDVAARAREMYSLLRRTLGEQTEIHTSSAPGLWPAMVDGRQLETALLNLCLNARDAMPEGGKLTIESGNVVLGPDDTDLDEEVIPGDYVSLAISDTGCGMTPEVVARAVDPFFTTKDVGKGSGLGLSMVYGFVKQSQGHLRIDSEVGHGTTVTLFFPRAPAAEAKVPDATPVTSNVGGHERILVVEDDELVRQHVVVQLTSMGYQVEASANGEAALKLLSERTDFDLLFSDIVMPGGMNGWQLANRARALHPWLCILLTSGYADSASALSGQPDGGLMLLTKPYRRRDLADKIREALLDRPSIKP
jgi:PAS domain S-box-containing protein